MARAYPELQESLILGGLTPKEPARFAENWPSVHPQIQSRLREEGAFELFEHQAEAIRAFQRGEDVLLSTGTGSGKTLAFVVPVWQTLIEEPLARALILYPTKALAQDQLGKLEEFIGKQGFLIATYDGDTPQRQRAAIRKSAQVVLTNPDMLHVGILPGYENWLKFLKSLRVIVLDEIHSYRGVFGSHVALTLRRLLRMCERVGSRPQILGASATIGNPMFHFERLTGRRPTVIDDDTSPKSGQILMVWRPNLEEKTAPPSPNHMSARLTVQFVAQQARVLTFCRSRLGVELVLRYARELAEAVGVEPAQIESYRAGYTPAERREVEQALFKGDLSALVATSAMELGVDVGGLDVAIINGFPGTVSAFRQQAGRVGRRDRAGIVVYLPHDDPLEMWLASSPSLLVAGPPEAVSISPENRPILESHIRCAAFERPLAVNELEIFGPDALDTAESLDRSGELAFRTGYFFYPSREAPAPNIDIRGVGGGSVEVFLNGALIGSSEVWRAKQTLFKGAVYLHRGAAYHVQSLDLDAKRVELAPFDGSHTTMSQVQSIVEPLVRIQTLKTGDRTLAVLESVRVTTEVTSFRRLAPDAATVPSSEPLDLPADVTETIAVRFEIDAAEEIDDELAAAIHGAEHALAALAPYFAGCDRGDLGSTWYVAAPDTLTPAIFLFDRIPGGIGLSEALFAKVEAWVESAHNLLDACDCDFGCPKCLLSPRCEINNDFLNKIGARDLLSRLQRELSQPSG